MKTGTNGINLIKSFEGLRLHAYKCPAGVWTIGYGHTKGVKKGDMITELKAETLLIIDLQSFEYTINKLVKVPLTQNQFDALVSFVFNVGSANFQKSTLLRKLNNKDYNGAANEFGKWVYANKKVLPGLVKRREAEKELFLKK